MTSSFTVSNSTTFSVTHARHLASKVATDLMRIHRLYNGTPTVSQINEYEAELIELLKAGYLQEVTYGFKRSGNWIEPTIKYTSRQLLGAEGADDDPGRIRAGKDISNAAFSSFLTYSSSWSSLNTSQQQTFESQLPFRRSDGTEPGIVGAYHQDLSYSAGGRLLERMTVRGY